MYAHASHTHTHTHIHKISCLHLTYRCEQALIQNEITDIFRDDFHALSEEDGMSGNRKESIISEYQSFTHLTYSKNKVGAWIEHGIPALHAPGMLQERSRRMHQLSAGTAAGSAAGTAADTALHAPGMLQERSRRMHQLSAGTAAGAAAGTATDTAAGKLSAGTATRAMRVL